LIEKNFTFLEKIFMTSHKILFVDDDIHILETIGELLASFGFDTMKVCNAESAIEILKGIKVDAVLTDLIMPGMSGLSFANSVAESQPGIPIVIYTGADIGNFQVSLSNIHSVLKKPVSPPILIQTLQRAISESRSSSNKYKLETSKPISGKS
jgi:DNA-binding NtrC family response regulator